MPPAKRRRKLLLFLCFGLAGVILAGLCFPVWLPWVLRPIAAHYGIQYAKCIRNGYQRLIFQRVVFTNQDLKIEFSELDSPAPPALLFGSAFVKGDEPLVHVRGWRLEVYPEKTEEGAVGTPSIFEIVQETDAVFHTITKWIHRTTLSEGVIVLPGAEIHVPSARWSDGSLNLTNTGVFISRIDWVPSWVSIGALTNMALSVAPGVRTPWKVRLNVPALDMQVPLLISTNQMGVSVQSKMLWRSNPITWDAQFGHRGVIPDELNVQAPDLHFSGKELGDYAKFNGSLGARWNSGDFFVDLKASGIPIERATNVPPFNLELHVSGNTNAAVFHSVAASLPWLEARLSKDFKFFFNGQHVREQAEADVRIDFGKQHWLPLEGVLIGNTGLRPGTEKFPQVQFHLHGSDVGSKEFTASNIDISGNCTWPWLEITQARARFNDGSTASVRGKLECDKRELSAGDIEFAGELLRRWLPPGCSYSSLQLTATAHGLLQALNHEGRLRITNFTSPQMKPLQLRLGWKGKQINLETASLLLSAPTASIAVDGALTVSASETNLSLKAVTLSKAGEPLLALAKPSTISWGYHSETANRWHAQVDPFECQGSGGRIHVEGGVHWPVSGNLNVSLENLKSSLAQDFLKSSLEPFEIQALKAFGAWSNGPLAFSLVGTGAMIPRKDLPLTARLNIHGDSSGVMISNLLVTSQTSSVVTGEGFLPVAIYPGLSTNIFRVNAKEPLRIVATTDPQSVFWERIAGWTGVSMVAPNLQVDISGTFDAPQGSIQAQASQLRFRTSLTNVPPLDDVDIEIELDRKTAKIKQCQCLVQGQPVLLTGELPLGESFWGRKLEWPVWKNARAHLMVRNAQLAAFTPTLSQYLSPQGELNIDAEMQPGPKFTGTLNVSHARTRSLAAFGPIRDIAVAMKIEGDKIRLDSATGNIGGATVTAKGETDLQGMNWSDFAVPPLKFSLRGTNVPLARRPESVIRSDLDLVVTKTKNSPALVSGKAHLGNSYFLHDIADLIPGKIASPGRRPPYFSIDFEPIADWRLAVQVTGERFLKVRSTIFNGEVSANLALQGTLKDPLALGDIRIDSGFVRFPFADLKVQQGFVTVNSQNPYRPQLRVSAVSRQYGYDIKMDVSGSADTPILQFTSSPPLSSEQIVLMITAGELPREGRSLSTQQRAQTLAFYVGKDLLTRLGFGDDKEQRLTIHSGEQLSEQGRPTYNVEYELTERWSLVGEYDRFNAYNAGLKWRIYSK
jgi:translocation and assembly module TamB